MTTRGLERVAEALNLAADGAAFEHHYGKNAGAFLVQLPALFHLFRRAAFDLSLPTASRHLAAAVTLYIAEPADFLGEETKPSKGLIDDVWVAYVGLARLVDVAGEKSLQPHWRGGDLSHVVGLARNVESLQEKIPHHVLDRVQRYLG